MSKGYSDYFLSFSKSSVNPNGRSFLKASPDSVLADPVFTQFTHDSKLSTFKQILEQKIHGISFSLYLDGQSPGCEILDGQILQRLNIIKPYAHWVRSFSCTEGNEEIPVIAQKEGFKTMVGIGLGDDNVINELEMKNGIDLVKSGNVNILAVGNEVLLRGDLSEDELIDYIQRAKQASPDVLVGYVDAYFLFENHPRVAEVCDVLLINCYPFWESTPAEYALEHMKEMYQRAVNVANGKQVIICETGWPNVGTPFGDAVPSPENALSYFISAYQWANKEGIEMFYFSSFDESWKEADEGDVGANWGLWDKFENLKYV